MFDPWPTWALHMRRYSQRHNLSTLSEINITPLLDLAFVLLIIFMITTPLLENSVNLIIPSSGAANAPVNPAQVQTISIDRQRGDHDSMTSRSMPATLVARLDGVEAGESGCGRRDSPRSRVAGAEIDRVDGCAAARANHQSRDRDEG